MGERPPKLGILISTYNRPELLRQCLGGATQTTVSDCEILVLDNGSTDNTTEVVKEFINRDERVKYVRNAVNDGTGKAWERAMHASDADYQTWIPDDDMALAGHFEKKVAILDAYPHIGLVHSPSYNSYEGRPDWEVWYPPMHVRRSYIGGFDEFRCLLPGNYTSPSAFLFRSHLLKDLRAGDPSLLQISDWEFELYYAYHCETAFINEPTSLVRHHSQSETAEWGARPNLALKLQVWRKWLINRQLPPVINEDLWNAIRDWFEPEVRGFYPSDEQAVRYWMKQFYRLRDQYFARMSQLIAI